MSASSNHLAEEVGAHFSVVSFGFLDVSVSFLALCAFDVSGQSLFSFP